jgi:hypothetical protein
VSTCYLLEYNSSSSLTVDNDSSSVDSSSTESMTDLVAPGPEGQDRDDDETSEAEDDNVYLDEEGEGDSLDDGESRSVESGSTGSLADFIAPDWVLEDSEGCEAVDEDGDYEDDSEDDDVENDDGHEDDGGQEDEPEHEPEHGPNDGHDDRDNRDNRDNQDATCKHVCLLGICDGLSSCPPPSCPPPVGFLHDTVSFLETLTCNLQMLAGTGTKTAQLAALYHHRPHYCCKRRGTRATRNPALLRRAGGTLVTVRHNNADSDASPLSPNWRRKRRRMRGSLQA